MTNRSMIQLSLSSIIFLALVSQSENALLAAPPDFNPNQVLCNSDFVNVNSLDQEKIQRILEDAGSNLAVYRDPYNNNQLASQIIFTKSREYKISPWFVLVKMETESSTVWGKNRTALNQTVGARGQNFGTLVEWILFYGWPDNPANIDPTQKGFTNQISNFARVLRSDFDDVQVDGKGRNGWSVGKTVVVRDDLKERGIKVTSVTPMNAITVALYIYTPHVYDDKLNLHSIWKSRVGNTGCDDSMSESPSVKPNSIPALVGKTVDDTGSGFVRTGTPGNWKESPNGYGGHFYWTWNNNKQADNIGTWKIRIDKPGNYEIFVYIPSEHATTKNTIYEIRHAGQSAKISVSQADHHNQWFSLGTYDFDGRSEEYVRLTDVSDEKAGQAEIAFDAIGYNYKEPGPLDEFTKGLRQWFDDRQKEAQRQFEQWLKEQQEKARREGERQIQRWIEEQCTRGSLIVLFPVLLLVIWTSIRRVL